MTEALKSNNSNNSSSIGMNAATNSETAPAPTPAQVVEQLRALAATFGEGAVLTPDEKRKVRQLADAPVTIVQAQINLIDVHERIAAAVGSQWADVRRMLDDHSGWTAVEDQLKRMHQAVYGANLVRKQKLALIGGQAALVGQALARNPEFTDVRAQMQEIRRVKRLSRRKTSPSAPQTPAPPDQHGGTGM